MFSVKKALSQTLLRQNRTPVSMLLTFFRQKKIDCICSLYVSQRVKKLEFSQVERKWFEFACQLVRKTLCNFMHWGELVTFAFCFLPFAIAFVFAIALPCLSVSPTPEKKIGAPTASPASPGPLLTAPAFVQDFMVKLSKDFKVYNCAFEE